MLGFKEYDENFRWVGEKRVSYNRKHHRVVYYKAFSLDGVCYEVGDFVLIRNDDSIDPEDFSNCYVGKIKDLFETDHPVEPHRAIVQWFSRLSELPVFAQRLVGKFNDWEVFEESRPNWSDDIDADTIFSKCVVKFLPVDADNELFEECNENAIPIFFCRYKFSGHRLLPVKNKVQDSSSLKNGFTTSEDASPRITTSKKERYIATPTGTPDYPKVLIKRIDDRLLESPNVRIFVADSDAKTIDDVADTLKRTLSFDNCEKRPIIHSFSFSQNKLNDEAEMNSSPSSNSVSKQSLRNTLKKISSLKDPEGIRNSPRLRKDRSCSPGFVNIPFRRKIVKSEGNDLSTDDEDNVSTPSKKVRTPRKSLKFSEIHKSSDDESDVSSKTNRKSRKIVTEKEIHDELNVSSKSNRRSRKIVAEEELDDESDVSSKMNRRSRKIVTEEEILDEPNVSSKSNRRSRKIVAEEELDDEFDVFSKTNRRSRRIVTEEKLHDEPNVSRKSNRRSRKIVGEEELDDEPDVSSKMNRRSRKIVTEEELDDEPNVSSKMNRRSRKIDAEEEQSHATSPKKKSKTQKSSDHQKSVIGNGIRNPPRTPSSVERTDDLELAVTRSGRKVKRVDYFSQLSDFQEHKKNVLANSVKKFIRATYSEESDSGSAFSEEESSGSESESDCPVEENRSRSSKKKPSNTPKTKTLPGKHLLFSMPKRETPLKEPQNVLEESRLRLHAAAVPKSLPCREAEYSDIYSFVRDSLCLGTGGCMYISGVPGTGKTATVHEVIRNLEEEKNGGEIPCFTFVEVNGMWMTDPYKCYVHIFKSLTGKSIASQQACNLLEKRFTGEGPKKDAVVLLVDELDRLWTRKQTVMYNIFDWPSRRNSKLVVLAIANTMDLPERLMMNRVTSRLGLSRITFQPYNFKQLQEIIMNRIQELKVFDPDAVQFVARKVAAVSGDARRALAICRHASEIVERSVGSPSKKRKVLIGMEHVDEAIQQMFSSPVIAFIKSSSRVTKLFLEGMLNEFTRTGSEETTLLKVSTHVVTVCKFEGLRPPSSSEISSVCAKLAASHVILVDNFQNDIHMKLRLGVDPDDVNYALTGKGLSH